MKVNKRPKGKAPPAALPIRLKFQPDLAIDIFASMMIIMAMGTRFYQTKEATTMDATMKATKVNGTRYECAMCGKKAPRPVSANCTNAKRVKLCRHCYLHFYVDSKNEIASQAERAA